MFSNDPSLIAFLFSTFGCWSDQHCNLCMRLNVMQTHIQILTNISAVVAFAHTQSAQEGIQGLKEGIRNTCDPFCWVCSLVSLEAGFWCVPRGSRTISPHTHTHTNETCKTLNNPRAYKGVSCTAGRAVRRAGEQENRSHDITGLNSDCIVHLMTNLKERWYTDWVNIAVQLGGSAGRMCATVECCGVCVSYSDTTFAAWLASLYCGKIWHTRHI